MNILKITFAVILLLTTLVAVDAATVLETFWTDGQKDLGNTITITEGQSVELFVWPTSDTPPMDLDIRLYNSARTVLKVYENHKSINAKDYSEFYTVNSADYGSEGRYTVEVFLKSNNGKETRSEVLTLIVNPSNGVNHPPVLNPIGNKIVNEGNIVTFKISATDADRDTLSFTSTSLPSGAKLTENHDNTATFSWTPTYSQAGNYPVTFTVKDTKNAQDSEVITITVKDSTTPEIDPGVPLAPYDPHPYHGETNVDRDTLLTWKAGVTPGLNFDVYFGTDSTPDITELVSVKQSSKSFDPDTLSYNTVYYWKVVARDRDGDETSSAVWQFTAKIPNIPHPPVLNPIGNKVADEGNRLTFKISATDADGDKLAFSAEYLPRGAVLMDNKDNTATFSWTPDYTQAGSYKVTFAVFDNSHGYDSEQITITVRDINSEIDPGVPLAPYDPHPYHGELKVNPSTLLTWKAGTSPGLTFDVYFGTDSTPDSTELVSKGQATKYYNPVGNLALSTTYYWKVVARDRDGDETSSAVWKFTSASSITTSNHPPVIEPIPDQVARVGITFTYDVEASDPDRDPLTYDIFDGMVYVDSNPNPVKIDSRTGLITFTPKRDQVGDKLYLTVEVRDNAGGISKESFTLTILRVDNHGGFDDDDDDNDDNRKPNTATSIRNGACREDYDGDRFGTYEQVRETIDLYTGTILSRDVITIDCLLQGNTEIVITGEKESDDKINWFVVALITALFAAIALLITWLGTREKEEPRPFKWQSGNQMTTKTRPDGKVPKSYY